jgi:hypothetical protein
VKIKDREILSLLKEMVKKAIEGMMKEERVGYLREHPETGGMGLLYILLCDLNRKILK